MARTQATYGIHEYATDNNTSFDEEPFNDIDGLIFSQLSTMDFSTVGIGIGTGVSKTIAQIYEEIKDTDAYAAMSEDNQRLLKSMAESDRYKDVLLSNYVTDPVKNGIAGFTSVGENADAEQFGAVTATYTENGNTVNYLSFQSTDDSLDGWSEDVMLMSCGCTQAQADSVSYINLVGPTLTGDLVGGGHSKGGNNFEYGFLFCDEAVRSRFVAGYLYDSPGLFEALIDGNEQYEAFLAITAGHFYCPQDSVFGMMLHENENAIFVYSVESGFNEHDPYSWEISGNSFVLTEQTAVSKYINQVIDAATISMTEAERQALTAVITYVFYHCDGGNMDSVIAMFGEGWTTEDGDFCFEKCKEVCTLFLDDWMHLSLAEQVAFCHAVAVILMTMLLVGVEMEASDILVWIEEKEAVILEALEQATLLFQTYALEVQEAAKEFFYELSAEVYDVVAIFTSWWSSLLSSGKSSVIQAEYFFVDTKEMLLCAKELQTISQSAKDWNNSFWSFYKSMDATDQLLLGQKALRCKSIIGNYTTRVDACASYLEQTALEFETVEREVGNGICL